VRLRIAACKLRGNEQIHQNRIERDGIDGIEVMSHDIIAFIVQLANVLELLCSYLNKLVM